MDRGRIEGMSEERLDDLLAGALAVEPSPDLMPQVRARIAAQAAAERRWRRWALSAVAVAAGLSLIAVGVARQGAGTAPVDAAATTPPRAMVVDAPPPAAAVLVAPPSAARPRGASPAVAPRTARRSPTVQGPRTGRPREPEVLVEPGQDEALLRFRAALRRGRVDARSLIASRATVDAPLPIPADIEIAPLEVTAAPDLGGSGVE